MKKKDYESQNYFIENDTVAEKKPKKKEKNRHQRLEIEEKRYKKKSPSVVKYKAKLKRINE